jgi:hypothetical protein
MLDSRIEAATRAARAAFWTTVASDFPEVKAGDFGPGETMEMEEMTARWVRSWVTGNRPPVLVLEVGDEPTHYLVRYDNDDVDLYESRDGRTFVEVRGQRIAESPGWFGPVIETLKMMGRPRP